MKNYFIYIITNPNKTVLYIGVTNNLKRRISEHTNNRRLPKTFAGRYHCNKLIYFEQFNDINLAIKREKQLKKWTREKKEKLIATKNKNWDFYNTELFSE